MGSILFCMKKKSYPWAKLVHTARAYFGFQSMEQLRVLLLPVEGMRVHLELP